MEHFETVFYFLKTFSVFAIAPSIFAVMNEGNEITKRAKNLIIIGWSLLVTLCFFYEDGRSFEDVNILLEANDSWGLAEFIGSFVVFMLVGCGIGIGMYDWIEKKMKRSK